MRLDTAAGFEEQRGAAVSVARKTLLTKMEANGGGLHGLLRALGISVDGTKSDLASAHTHLGTARSIDDVMRVR